MRCDYCRIEEAKAQYVVNYQLYIEAGKYIECVGHFCSPSHRDAFLEAN